jgi:tetratricopeptide (TPR) repeat protein
MAKCFVVQGFGKKTDYTDGRVLDLDASYAVIKEAVESAGVECVRADEIVHSGTIDVPMYEQLLRADLVIADLSTYNVNAAFELGVRYALRPGTTIVLAEQLFTSPFDVGHVLIRRYQHLGEDIGSREARRLRDELRSVIATLLNNPQPDSPVYTYLPRLRPPEEGPTESEPTASRGAVAARTPSVAPPAVAAATGDENPSAKLMLDLALANIAKSDFTGARVLLQEVKKLRPNDPFVTQQLALAIYKSKQPDPERAIMDARDVLLQLSPETSNDPETLGLWGAVHKRAWEQTADPKFLTESIRAYERGFLLKQDHYNGINLAFLLNLRALEYLKAGQRDEAIADTVRSRHVREDVIRYTTPLINAPDKPAADKLYWIFASLWEAAVGLGDDAAAARWESELKAMGVADWMQDTRENQGARLRELLQAYAEQLARLPAG